MILPVAKLGTLLLKTMSKPIATRLKTEASRHPKFRQLIINLAQDRPPKFHRLDFPRYDGKADPLLFINKYESFFLQQCILLEEQVWLASFHLEQAAQQRYMRLQREEGTPPAPLRSCPLSELATCRRTGSVADYTDCFLDLLSRVGPLSENQQIHLFTLGLFFNCDEKYGRGNNRVCKHLFFLELNDDDTKDADTEEPTSEEPVISLHTIVGVTTSQTMHVPVVLGGVTANHRISTNIQRRVYGHSTNVEIRPLNEEKAVQAAADLIGELFVFSLVLELDVWVAIPSSISSITGGGGSAPAAGGTRAAGAGGGVQQVLVSVQQGLVSGQQA
ncbi:hypothetical protein U9M48_023557 [Paspalum notatum var. saurae]|uniref:Uncharacterized protein n=1 Tax=Paspalum notatum var. saurae TaxID=547442 RepID=A0AAQ3TQV2_PASNO